MNQHFSVASIEQYGKHAGYRLISDRGYSSKMYLPTAEILVSLKASADFHNGVPPVEIRTIVY